MKRICKYEIGQKANVLAGQLLFDIELPKGAKILKVDEQGESYFLWALVDSSKEQEHIAIAAVVTGEDIPESLCIEHLETVLSYEGQFVVHFLKVLNFNNDGKMPIEAK